MTINGVQRVRNFVISLLLLHHQPLKMDYMDPQLIPLCYFRTRSKAPSLKAHIHDRVELWAEPECNKFVFVYVNDKWNPRSTNRANCWTIRGDPFFVNFLLNTKGFGATSGLQFLLIGLFDESDGIYVSWTTIITWQTTSNLKIW